MPRALGAAHGQASQLSVPLSLHGRVLNSNCCVDFPEDLRQLEKLVHGEDCAGADSMLTHRRSTHDFSSNVTIE
jgi:hypothetical protein